MWTYDVFLFVVLSYTCTTVNGNAYFPANKPINEWWSNTIIYQVYPKSFKDSDNDGVGDLKGIINKLDHFVDLGIETLWVGPFFKSPMDDMGYDVEDFKMIDPVFGTMNDFDELVLEMKKRNLKLIIDFIPNHSSYKCDWFQKSIKREDKYEDYYVWRNASNQDELIKSNSSIEPKPPNNWLSVFGGSIWSWNNERKQFYLHQFSSKQPDFNYRNPKVHKEMLDILAFWMDKGIVGFRFDAIRFIYENDSFLDEPCLMGNECSTFYGLNHIYTLEQPESTDIIMEWREFMDNYSRNKNMSISSLLVTETYSPNINFLMKHYGNSTKPGADVPFNFGLVFVDKRNIVESIDNSIKNWLYNMPENQVANWVVENHDRSRIPAKFGAEMVPLFTALKLSLPGVEVTYYGSEIGMDDTYVRPDQIQSTIKSVNMKQSRDYARCPMQWDSSINAGFTEKKKPWLPINPNYYKLNVELQKKIPTSNYNFYKKMSQLRKTDTLKNGDLQTYSINKSIYILKRSLLERESYIVVMNFGSETETVILSNIVNNLNDELYVYVGSENSAYNPGNIISTVSSPGDPLKLRPQSVVVLTDKNIAPETPTIDNKNVGTQIGSTLISVLCSVILFLRRFL